MVKPNETRFREAQEAHFSVKEDFWRIFMIFFYKNLWLLREFHEFFLEISGFWWNSKTHGIHKVIHLLMKKELFVCYYKMLWNSIKSLKLHSSEPPGLLYRLQCLSLKSVQVIDWSGTGKPDCISHGHSLQFPFTLLRVRVG